MGIYEVEFTYKDKKGFKVTVGKEIKGEDVLDIVNAIYYEYPNDEYNDLTVTKVELIG